MNSTEAASCRRLDAHIKLGEALRVMWDFNFMLVVRYTYYVYKLTMQD